jgi:S1-C subfamily serine protease
MKKVILLFIFLYLSFNHLAQCFQTEEEFKDYYTKNISKLDPIEGIWSVNATFKLFNSDNQLVESKYSPQNSKVAIIKEGDHFLLCRLLKKEDNSIIIISKTANDLIYLYQKTFTESNSVAKTNMVLSLQSILEYSYEIPKAQLKISDRDLYYRNVSQVNEIKMVKLYPTEDDLKKFLPSSGTGFALNSEGYIVTNQHVVNDATSIHVRGINGDFEKKYKAKLIVADKKNDLAIIKIDEEGFSSLGTIPYTVANKSIDVGSSIFCLGYPLRAALGEEVKLTNGIISAKSGFKGDVTSYQVSAPVQPGNSGGPLFDDSGNLIGIINAKFLDAENVTYAIKASYLINLLDMLPSSFRLNQINNLKDKSLVEQVKLAKGITFIIEVN